MTVTHTSAGGARVTNVVTSGTFSLDGGTWDVDNNVWIIGDDAECVIIDPAHEPAAILEAVAGRKVTAILLTHGHDDHIRAVREVAGLVDAPIYLNPADDMLWDQVYSEPYDHPISGGDTFSVAGVRLTAIHTPGHSPGSTCFYAPDLGDGGVLFSGDTLFNGGPGATGRSFSDFPTIIESIRDKILVLPESTDVLTGHGDATRVGAEAPNLQAWIDRGH